MVEMQARPTASNSSPSGRASLPCCGLMGTRSPHAGKRTPTQSQTQGCPRSPCHSHLPRLGSEKERKALVSGARLRMASQTQEVLPSYWPSPGIDQVLPIYLPLLFNCKAKDCFTNQHNLPWLLFTFALISVN